MLTTECRRALTIILISLACSGICLAGFDSAESGQTASVQISPPKDKNANPPGKDAGDKGAKQFADNTDKMFPDGLVHDFGKVQRGKLITHTFRVVNTSKVPLHMILLRCA